MVQVFSRIVCISFGLEQLHFVAAIPKSQFRHMLSCVFHKVEMKGFGDGGSKN